MTQLMGFYVRTVLFELEVFSITMEEILLMLFNKPSGHLINYSSGS